MENAPEKCELVAQGGFEPQMNRQLAYEPCSPPDRAPRWAAGLMGFALDQVKSGVEPRLRSLCRSRVLDDLRDCQLAALNGRAGEMQFHVLQTGLNDADLGACRQFRVWAGLFSTRSGHRPCETLANQRLNVDCGSVKPEPTRLSGNPPIFKKVTDQGIDFWTGDPTCQMAHDAILKTLQQIGYFIGLHEALGTRRQGNLGEFIAFHAALSDKIPYTFSMGASGMDPLQNVAAPGLDITYLYFDNNNPFNDLIYIQEVKTTGQVDLAYADKLVSDHDKLFGGDPALTLNSRIQSMGLRLKLQYQRPDLAARLQSMAATAPLSCSHIRLVPTLVHDRIGTDPKTKLLAIRSQINALGWPLGQIRPWSIGMENLIDRLTRLARGLS